ncbi:PQQ-binding-like beta-propeller repeat protein [Oharaeibacter diazotrophicus]|uniref:Outer membrane protein assembly factor BamB n=1 Tax=Oharaeibacter diazotrophicus TaxID=1920512 RepID=A0A4R6RLW0_9HYPH|nr:PQQ-binding-like beta-propeller repeat protein [Oharaeibacter diazotrophicus]TDP87659.1 outer membrane protein assembly factor BamB [Oharaeibacter diazotrophicus]BBE74757.1 outer membrane biogenesis protein BamB [Pleomorphomonas sp. SM30]GLS77140.1 hypothetical protein GCM10007904_24770 [Oharaeibacter diazotrophicus]
MKLPAVLVALAIFPSSGALASPRLSIDPVNQIPGGSITVSAAGFSERETLADVYIDGTRVGMFPVSGGGFADGTIQLDPDLGTGAHLVMVIGKATAAFDQWSYVVTYNWPQPFRDGARSNVTQDRDFDADTVAHLGLVRTIPVGDVAFGPVRYDGRIYLTTAAGQVRSIGLLPEQRSWTADVGARSAPIAHDGRILTVSGDGTVTALDHRTGRVLGRRALGAPWSARFHPVLADGILYVQTRRGLFALHASDLSIAWVNADVAAIPSPGGVAVDADRVVAVANGRIHWLSPEDGSEIGSHPGTAPVKLVDGRISYNVVRRSGQRRRSEIRFASFPDEVARVLPAGRNGILSFPTRFGSGTYALLRDDRLGSRHYGELHLHSFDLTDRRVADVLLPLQGRASDLTGANGFLVASLDDVKTAGGGRGPDRLVVLEPPGNVRFQWTLPGAGTVPIVSDGRIYVVAGGTLHVFGRRGGGAPPGP